MKNQNLARMYRLPETTTPEDLGIRWTCHVDFGTRFLVAGYWYSWKEPCYYGAIYEHVDYDLSCEGEIRLIAVSEQRFEDYTEIMTIPEMPKISRHKWKFSTKYRDS